MSHTMVNQVKKIKVGHPIAKSILLYLADSHNPTHGCFPSQSDIAADLELSPASVHRYIEYLETRQFIERKFDRSKGKILRTYYEFNTVPQIVSNGVSPILSHRQVPIPQIPSPYPTDTTHLIRNTVNKNNKKIVDQSTQITRGDIEDDRAYVTWLSEHPKYAALGVKEKYNAMLDWCEKKAKPPTRLRLVTWLNKDLGEIPMAANGNGNGKRGCSTCLEHPHRNEITIKGGGFIFDPSTQTATRCKCNGST